MLQTGNRSERAFRDAQNIAHRILRRVTRQLIAALCAARRGHKTRTRKLYDDLLQIFCRNLLSPGNIAKRYIAAGVVLRKIDHQSKRISSFG